MKKLYKNEFVLDLIATIMFFTRIPVNWSYFSNTPPNLTKAAWAFPLVGFFIGVLSGLVGDLFIYLGIPIFLSVVIAIAFSVLITGAFHEDGLADSADGLGAGGTPKRINEIIHDSRLGTYGVLSLILGILIRLGLLLTLVEAGYSLVSILSVGFASGKLAILYTRNFFSHSKYARIGTIISKISFNRLVLATLIWILPTLLIFPLNGILLGIILMILISFLLGLKSKKALGGITGDILGAIAFLTELVFLFGNIIMVNTN